MATLKERATEYKDEHANVMNLARENKYDEARAAQSALLKKAGLTSQAEVEESGLGGVDVEASTWMPQAAAQEPVGVPATPSVPEPQAVEQPSRAEATPAPIAPVPQSPELPAPMATPLSVTALGGGVPQTPAVQGLAGNAMAMSAPMEEAPASAPPTISGTVPLRQLSRRSFPENSMALAGLRKVY